MHSHYALRVRIRQRLEEYTVYDAEDRGVHPNAQRERRQRDDRKARVVAEDTKSVANILPEVHDRYSTTACSMPACDRRIAGRGIRETRECRRAAASRPDPR